VQAGEGRAGGSLHYFPRGLIPLIIVGKGRTDPGRRGLFCFGLRKPEEGNSKFSRQQGRDCLAKKLFAGDASVFSTIDSAISIDPLPLKLQNT
jgi:hypothetical protein